MTPTKCRPISLGREEEVDDGYGRKERAILTQNMQSAQSA